MMKYCKKCKHIHEDKFDVCTECRKPQPLYPIEDENTPVFLLTASGFEAQRVQSALESSGIPSELAAHKNAISADAVTGSDITDKDILVPYAAYEQAYDIAVGIGAIKPEGEEIKVDMQDVEDAAEADEQVEMSPAKRTTVKIVSAILLIILFCLVIWGTDFLTGFLTGFFK